jgi:hypothetical protein
MNMIDYMFSHIKNQNKSSQFKLQQGDYYMEESSYGLLLYAEMNVILFQYDGKVVRLGSSGAGRRHSETDWKIYCELYESISKMKNLRIEIPISRETLELEEYKLDHVIVQRPNYQIGKSFYEEVKDNSIDDAYFLNYIEETDLLLEHIIPILKKHEAGYPTELLSIYKRVRDDVGYFWIDFKRFNKNPYDFYNKKIRTLYLTLLTLKNLNYNKIMNKAEISWSKILK